MKQVYNIRVFSISTGNNKIDTDEIVEFNFDCMEENDLQIIIPFTENIQIAPDDSLTINIPNRIELLGHIINGENDENKLSIIEKSLRG